MTVKYKEGRLEIDLHDMLQSVSEEMKLEMVESLACDDEIIKHVADQIITGWTEGCCHGGRNCTASPEPHQGLDWACREIAKHSGDIAKQEIERLEKAVAYERKCYTESLEENRRLRGQLYNR